MPERKSKSQSKKKVEPTSDGHYVVIDGRRWRATNPHLSLEERQKLVNELMAARRAVAVALKAKDVKAERGARDRVHAAKVALGERGPKWWEENSRQKAGASKQKAISTNKDKNKSEQD